MCVCVCMYLGREYVCVSVYLWVCIFMCECVFVCIRVSVYV